MTTAEFIIGHSADDAAERKKEAQKILWALLAALCIHLLIGYSLAVFGGLLYSPFSAIEEDKPVELTFVNLPPVATPVPTPEKLQLTELDRSKESSAPPEEKTYQANINSTAASEQPAAGSAPIPTQDGKNRPSMTLDNERHRDAVLGAQPQLAETQTEQSQPETMPSTPPKSEAEQFALLTSTPHPTAQPSIAPKPAQDYQREKLKTRVSGSITNRGRSSVNAIGTPLGQYSKILYDAVDMHFQMHYQRNIDLVAIGTVELHLIVGRNGKVKDLKVVKNTANETLVNICLRSVQEAQFPPIPDDLAETLPPEGLEWDPTFRIFPQYQ